MSGDLGRSGGPIIVCSPFCLSDLPTASLACCMCRQPNHSLEIRDCLLHGSQLAPSRPIAALDQAGGREQKRLNAVKAVNRAEREQLRSWECFLAMPSAFFRWKE